jgi:Bacterial PH domain
MKEQLKKILNEDQDPKAIEKITSKLENILMSNEEIGYIAVQKKPAITVLPDSIVVTNKRIILCKPKNLGLSMEFIDYDWDDVSGSFVKEGILGADFTFSTKSDLTHTIDYLPKSQARKLYTFSKEQLDIQKNGISTESNLINDSNFKATIDDDSTVADENTILDEVEPETETDFLNADAVLDSNFYEEPIQEKTESFSIASEKKLGDLSKEELFEKLQNYKKLLDNALITQGEYENYKKEILGYM